MKKLFTLLTLLLCVASSAWADYNNEDATVTWAFTLATDLTSTNVPQDAFMTTQFNCGSNLNASSVIRSGKNNAWGQSYNMVAFIPTVAVPKNDPENSDNTLEWVVTPAKGITFIPTKVSLIGCNYGGTGDPKTNIYVFYSDNSEENLATNITLIRDDKSATDTGGGDSPSMLSYTLAKAVAGKFTLRVWMNGLTNTAKGVAFTNIVIEGKVSGTPQATTLYTLTAQPNDTNLGVVSGGGDYEENENVTLTATAKTGAKFVKWQKDGQDFDGNENAAIQVSVTGDATYTAIFAALNKILFQKGEGTGTAPDVVYVDDGESYTIPYAYFLFKSGSTLTQWEDIDDAIDYNIGATISNITHDITLSPVFTENTVELGDYETTIDWTFARDNGAPTISCENSETDYVQHTSINNVAYDAVMHVDTRKDKVISGSTGKLNNTSNTTCAQVNKATKFTVPIVDGAAISYTTTNGVPTASDITFGGNEGTVNESTVSYTYSGSAGTLDIIDVKGGFYPSGIRVVYPKVIPTPSDPKPLGGDAITWSFTDLEANSLTSDNTYSFTADDGQTEMRYTAGSSDGIIAKDGNTDGYLKENGASGSSKNMTDVDQTSFTGKTRLIRLFVTGQGTLAINCKSSNVGVYKVLDGDVNGNVLIESLSGNTESSAITVGNSPLWIETTTKGYINTIVWTPVIDKIELTTTSTMQGWRTFYDADNSYTVDENTKVYVATEENEGNVSLKEYAAGIPAATPVILKTNASAENDGTFKMTLTKTTETITPTYTGESLLKVTPFEGNWYRLGSKNGEVGFFPFNATGAAAGIVVLNIDSSNAGARGLTFSFADDETTAIQNVNGNDNVNKNVYDLQGRRVAKPTKGMYIVNGKKVIIK